MLMANVLLHVTLAVWRGLERFGAGWTLSSPLGQRDSSEVLSWSGLRRRRNEKGMGPA